MAVLAVVVIHVPRTSRLGAVWTIGALVVHAMSSIATSAQNALLMNRTGGRWRTGGMQHSIVYGHR